MVIYCPSSSFIPPLLGPHSLSWISDASYRVRACVRVSVRTCERAREREKEREIVCVCACVSHTTLYSDLPVSCVLMLPPKFKKRVFSFVVFYYSSIRMENN